MSPWPHVENIFTMILACTMVTLFYWWTESLHAFWWLLLFANINYYSKSGSRT